MLETPTSTTGIIARNARERRLALNMTQQELSRRSGVSFGSLRRFELTGQISLESLLKLALVLDCLPQFVELFKLEASEVKSIDDLLKEKPKRQRGRNKP
jgi:transcriptional regulator with XRE-family HTH domain